MCLEIKENEENDVRGWNKCLKSCGKNESSAMMWRGIQFTPTHNLHQIEVLFMFPVTSG